MNSSHLRNVITAVLTLAIAVLLVTGMYKWTLWQAEQRQSVISDVAGVDQRLRFLESTIVGNCPDDHEVPDNARCKQGFHQQHAQKMQAEIMKIIAAICLDNDLQGPGCTLVKN